MSSIQQATGQQIVRVSGGINTYVGIYAASDIDLDITRNTPNSNPEEATLWIRNLLIGAGLNPGNGQNPGELTDAQLLHATVAQRWYSWLYYWRMSRQSESCPSDCKDPARYEENKNRALKELCFHLKALGLTDPQFCKLQSGAESLKSISSSLTKF